MHGQLLVDSNHGFSALTLAKLYTNSLMTLFNNRAQISKTTSHGGGGTSISLKPMNVNLSREGRPGIHSRAYNPPNVVNTTVETAIDTDDHTGDFTVSIRSTFHNVRSEWFHRATTNQTRIIRMDHLSRTYPLGTSLRCDIGRGRVEHCELRRSFQVVFSPVAGLHM
jgi:hypothetical protein